MTWPADRVIPARTKMQNYRVNQDYIFFNLDNNVQSAIKPPRIRPNILRKRPRNPPFHVANGRANVVELKKIYSECNDDDCDTYVLDENEFIALPSNTTENTENATENTENATKENVQEIVITKDEVHLLNNPKLEPQEALSTVCRTCLALIPPGKYKKLLDHDDAEESDRLRKKLIYVTGDMDFAASVDPVVCLKCVTLIDIAYRFKVKAREVENRIEERCYRKGKLKTMVNLRSLIGKRSHKSRECRKINKPVCEVPENVVNSSEVIIIDENTSSLIGNKSNEGPNCQETDELMFEVAKSAVDRSEVIIIEEDSMSSDNGDCDVSTTCVDSKILQDYLANRENALERHFRNETPPPSPTNGNVNPVNTNQEPCLQFSDDLNQTNIASGPKVLGVQHLRRTSSPGPLFFNVKLRVKRADDSSDKKWVVSKEEDENGQAMSVNGQGADGPSNVVERYPPWAYKTRNRKPMVPKTFDLFDKEHDKYFNELEGDAGHFMKKKWAIFSRRPPQFGNGPYLCELCGVVIHDKTKFQRHTYKHAYQLPQIMCSYCGKFCRGNQHLNNHITCKHKPPSLQCEICDKMFHLPSQLSIHTSTVHFDSQKRQQCHHCGKLVKYGYLTKHMDTHNENTYTCDVCQEVFPTHFSRYRHRRTHFKRFTCKICGADFKGYSSMRQHVLNVHEGIRWQCMVCNKLMARKDHVLQHYKNRHAGLRRRLHIRNVVEAEEKPAEEPKLDDSNYDSVYEDSSMNEQVQGGDIEIEEMGMERRNETIVQQGEGLEMMPGELITYESLCEDACTDQGQSENVEMSTENNGTIVAPTEDLDAMGEGMVMYGSFYDAAYTMAQNENVDIGEPGTETYQKVVVEPTETMGQEMVIYGGLYQAYSEQVRDGYVLDETGIANHGETTVGKADDLESMDEEFIVYGSLYEPGIVEMPEINTI